MSEHAALIKICWVKPPRVGISCLGQFLRLPLYLAAISVIVGLPSVNVWNDLLVCNGVWSSKTYPSKGIPFYWPALWVILHSTDTDWANAQLAKKRGKKDEDITHKKEQARGKWGVVLFCIDLLQRLGRGLLCWANIPVIDNWCCTQPSWPPLGFSVGTWQFSPKTLSGSLFKTFRESMLYKTEALPNCLSTSS